MSASNPQAVEEMFLQMCALYLEELPDKIQEIEQTALSFFQENHNADIYQELYRQVHSLKGTAGTYRLSIITKICHQFEDQLKELDVSVGVDAGELKSLLKYVDLLRSATELLQQGSDDFSDIDDFLVRRIQHGRILLVSGSSTEEQLCRSIAENLSAQLVVIRDGYEALGRLLHEHFDILISSYELQGLNGLALIAALRLAKTENPIATVLLTSSRISTQGGDIAPNHIIMKNAQFTEHLQRCIKSHLHKAA